MQKQVTGQGSSECQLSHNNCVTLEELIVESLSRLHNFLLNVLSKEFVHVRHVFVFTGLMCKIAKNKKKCSNDN